jgi:uncharacterized membrane protein YGL010W
MLALQLAVAFFIFVLTMFILLGMFATVLIGLGPWWIAAFVAAFFMYRLDRQYSARARRKA